MRLSAVRGRVGLAVTGLAFAVMASALVQYLLAVNARRRMDLAFSGGFAGLGLLVLGVVVLLCERAWAAVEQETVEQRAWLAARAGAVEAGPVVFAVPDVVVASANSYHRPDCLLVAGREGLRSVSMGEAAGEGLSACRLCLKGVGS